LNHQDASASLDISVEMPRAAASESQLANQTIGDDSMVMPDMPDMPDMPEVILSVIVFFPEMKVHCFDHLFCGSWFSSTVFLL
jgi:hypothetical protein